MRNYLVFPDGSQKDFMYPTDRDILIGDKLQCHMKDESIHIMMVNRIEKTDKAIFYHLVLS